MLRYNRNRARGRFFPLFSPRELFYGSVPGAWYDPTDLSTMFQDSTGTTPVTAVEQPVGRILDKSGNGNHASQSTAASRPTYRARYNALTQSETFTGAPWLTGSTSGAITRSTISTQDPTGATSNVSTVAFPAVPAGQFSIVYQDSGATYLNVNVTWSVWLRVASGTATIYLNVEDTAAAPAGGNAFVSPPLTLTTTWQRFTLTGTRTANTGNLGVFFGFDTRANVGQTNAAPLTVQVWGAQLLTAADVTATGNAYQRIAAATVYDTAPIFRPYLAFDGVDDSLSTAAINFTSTDKMTVFAGVTKLSTVVGMITELSAIANLNAGAFYIDGNENAAGDFTFRLSGSPLTVGGGSTAGASVPVTQVLTSSLNQAGATLATQNAVRINAASAAYVSNVGLSGGGNFGNWPLFIGRRNNASTALNGRIYELIVRGAASSVTEIADTELWVNARTGAY